MSHRPPRLGDVVDDWCSRCRLLMNHGVVGMMDRNIGKVRCLTCYFEHPYRHGRAGKSHDRKKREMKKLFDQVLRGKAPAAAAVAENKHRPPDSKRKVRIARPEAREDHPHLERKSDPPAATLPPAPKDKGKVASWRRAWEDRLKK